MASDVIGGQIIWNLDLDSNKFTRGLDDAQNKVDSLGDNIRSADKRIASWASSAQGSFSSIADGLGKVLLGASALAVGGSFGFLSMTKAAYDQVKSVEEATFALRAYETNGQKVKDILSQLITFARSDMGVLFQRDELFKAASNLRGFGDSAENVVGHVKTLSKGVSLGMTTFDELSQIIGRATQQGKVSAEIFDMLAQRGIILNSSFRGAAVTTEQLYKELNRVLPESLLEGRAQTIEGRIIRLQSSFRDLGAAILGVDKSTSTFIKGGLGDTLVSSLEKIRTALKDPALITSFQQIGKAISDFAIVAIPVLIQGFTWIVNNMDTVSALFASLVTMFVAAKVAAFAFGIAAAISLGPFYWIPMLIIAVVGALTFLQIKFDIFGKTITLLKTTLTAIGSAFQWLGTVISGLVDLVIKGDFVGNFGRALGLDEDSPIIIGILTLRTKIVTFFSSLPSLILGFLVGLPGMMWSFVWNVIILGTVQFLGFLLGLIIFGIPNLITTIMNFLLQLPGMIWNVLLNIYNFFVTAWQNIWDWLMNTLPKIIADVVSFFLQLPGKIWSALMQTKDRATQGIMDTWNAILNEVKQWPSRMFDWGKKIMQSFADGIKNAIGSIADAFKSGMDRARKLVEGKSPPIAGPFKDIDKWGFNIGSAWVEGMQTAIGGLQLSPGIIDNTYRGGSPDMAGGGGITNNNTNAPVFNFNVGTFVGTETEKRQLAKTLQDAYQDYLKGRGQT